ncbi:MAG: ABC transporter substrate-binding protein [Synergistaceae bacterium]|jgi:simple sugar transport system substrate-binding protein|nr:ABC transporter substrate-binding protein [Synergistaceae bacterium]
MKKIVLLLLSALALSLGAIFYIDPGRAPDAPEIPLGSKVVLGFAQLGAESEWRSASSESVIRAAEKYGVELMFENAQQKQENQIKAIRSFIAHRVDVIAFSPVVESGWDNVLIEARAVGIPVILVDRKIETDLRDVYISFLGSDFVEEGRKAGRWMRSKFGGEGRDVCIVELRGTEGASPTKGRDEGFREAISGDRRFRIVRSLSGDFMRSKGRETMEHILSEYYAPDEGRGIDVIFAHNDDMAMGAIEALESRGIKPGHDVVIISVDAQRSALDALKNGKLNCVVECTPYVGERLMQLVKALASGEEIPSAIYSEETMFTEDDPPESLPEREY